MKVRLSVDVSTGTVYVDIDKDGPGDRAPDILRNFTVRAEGSIVLSLPLHMHGTALHTICRLHDDGVDLVRREAF